MLTRLWAFFIPHIQMKTLLLALLYILTGKLGLMLAVPPGYATIIWPPSGIAIGLLIAHSWRLWPGVFIGSFLLNSYISGAFSAESGWITVKAMAAVGIAVGSTLQALAGYALIRRFIGLPLMLTRIKQMAQLIALCGPVSCLIAASIGVGTLYAIGAMPLEKLAHNWFTWWAGDVLGVIVFLPLVLLAPGTVNRFTWRGNTIGSLPLRAMLAVLVPLGFTFYAWKITSENTYRQGQANFQTLALESEKALLHRLDSYHHALKGGAGFFQGSDYVSRMEWKHYVETIEVRKSFPGINGIGWITPVKTENLPAFVNTMRHEGAPDFRVHPATSGRPYYLVAYTEPEAINRPAIGLNIAFEDRRLQAAEFARDSGKSTITKRIILVQDAQKTPGFLLFHPMYHHHLPINTREERRTAFKGWIYAPFVANHFLQNLTQSQGRTLNLVIHDGAAESLDALIYESNDIEKAHKTPARYTIKKQLNIMQQTWTVTWSSTPAFERQEEDETATFVLLGGLLVSGMFALLLLMLLARKTEVMEWAAAEDEPISPIPLILAKCFSAAILLLGIVVIVGWHLRVDAFIQVHPTFPPMQYNTALSFILASGGLFAIFYGKRSLALLFSLSISIISGLTLLEYGLDVDMGIDRLFIEPYLTVTPSHPGRMSLVTAWAFLLTTLTLIGAGRSTHHPWSIFCVRLSASLVLILGIVPLTGYLTGISFAYSWGHLTRMAVHTASAFTLLGLAAHAYLWHAWVKKEHNAFALWLAAIASGTALVFTLAIWQESVKNEQALAFGKLREEAALIKQRIHDTMNNSVIALRRMAQRWELRGSMPKEEWTADARNYISDMPVLTTIEWVDSTYHIRWVEPLKGNEQAEGLDIAFNAERKKILEGAANTSAITLTPPLDVVQGYRAVIAYLPITIDHQFSGFIVGVYDTTTLARLVIPAHIEETINIELIDTNQLIYRSPQQESATDARIRVELPIFNKVWVLSAQPHKTFFDRHMSLAPYWGLLGGLVISLLIGVATYYAITAAQRNKLLLQKSRALAKSEAEFRTSMQYASIGMALVRPDGRWLKVNQSLCELLGYDEIELLENDVQSVTHPDDLDADSDYVRQMLKGEIKTCKMEKRYFHKSGRIIWALLSVSLVSDNEGKPSYFIAQIQDITEQKEVERIKSEFISTVSHELRTPLTSIRGSLGLVLGALASELPAKAKALIDIAHNNCERLILLINDILDIDKIAAGQMRFDMKEESLAAITQQAVHANEAYADKFNVKIVLEPMDETLKIEVDAARYLQVLSNLLSNAAKFSPPGSAITLSVQCPTHHRVRIAIKDCGPGIAEEFHSRIFGKFSQADSSLTRAKGGTGLGLHITKQLVEHMKGSIGFDTQIGQGTTFWVEFPLSSPASTCAALNYAVMPDRSHLPFILHVEDDAEFSKVLAAALHDKAEILTATTLQQAEQYLAQQHFRMIILDIGLPDGSGLTLLDRLDTLSQEPLPVVILSADSPPQATHGLVAAVTVKSRMPETKIVETIVSILETHNERPLHE